MKQRFEFPKGFMWGTATSAEQSESRGNVLDGGKAPTAWNWWYGESSEPFFDGKFCENDFYHKWKEDIDLLVSLNLDSIRLSISWARLIPDGVNINPEGVEFYKKVFSYVKEKGITLFVCLYHFDAPIWAEKKGGWTNRDIPFEFEKYCEISYREFGEFVDYWVTFNESLGPVMATHLMGKGHPTYNKDKIGPKWAARAMWNISIGHALAVRKLREIIPDGKIGSVYVGSIPIPQTDSPEDIEAARLTELFAFEGIAFADLSGEFPKELIEKFREVGAWEDDIIQPGDEDLFKSTHNDFAALNYYQPFLVKGSDKPESEQRWFMDKIDFWRPEVLKGNVHKGFGANAEGLYKRLIRMKDTFGDIPILIGEIGLSKPDEDQYRGEDGKIDDPYRVNYMSEHLYWIHKAIQEGANVIGAHQWTYIDNWSWTNAYKNRYGYIELDLKTGERKEKTSANWIRKASKENAIEFDPEIEAEY